MAPLSNICRRIFLSTILQRNGRASYRLISTSGKNDDADKSCEEQQTIYKKVPDFAKPLENKNWVSYGYDQENKDEDRFNLHFNFFTFITLLICGGGFIHMYAPDRGRYDWAKREAFIRLHEREELGLDLIDPNYVHPNLIELPADEDLLEEDIVI